MGFLIDRRNNPKQKSTVNRQRFLRRYRQQIQEAVSENLRGRHITDNDRGEKIAIPSKDIGEPRFHHGAGGRITHVVPGNDQYTRGDRIPRPESGGGGSGQQGSADGEGMDEFVFQINRDEFLDVLFDDMELPNLTKRLLSGQEEFKRLRGGFTSAGPPSNLSVVRSMRSATARRIALGAGRRTELRELEKELAELPEESAERREEIEARISELREALSRIPFLDDVDIRYHRHYHEPIPHSKAVMFCVMDVSGSMDQSIKDLAKRFYILLYLFLSRNYDRTELVFIRHHTVAKEVDEDEFFNSRETGGTVVSSALEMMKTIIEARYSPTEWNIYGAQASDGDNWPDDAQRCLRLINEVLPLCQYYAYVEITDAGDKPLWNIYSTLLERWNDVFAMQHITGPGDIYPVFHELFRKQTA
ncbi:YeaH/YhbH family protein [Haliea sp. E17]|uniref:YeaH/YhbH family protein n=1 Tax=Haliea sp. E17 TaxID=3401576 RepID=UPI003AAC6BB1